MDVQRFAFCNPAGGGFKYIVDGYVNALESIGIMCKKWNGDTNQLAKFDPTVYIGATGWRQTLPKSHHGKTRVVLHVNPYCRETIKHQGPIINETQDGIKWALDQNPDAVFGYGTEDDIKRYWAKWVVHTRVLPLPPAGDSTRFYPDVEPQFQGTIGFIGGRWSYKAKSIDLWLLPTLRRFDAKVYGWGGWENLVNYGGQIADGNDRKLLSSVHVGPSIHEPHSHKYGIDIPERIFKVPLCGTATLCEPVAGIHRYFPKDILPVACSPKEYESICEDLIKNDNKRQELAGKQRAHVLKHHTYYSRIAVLLDALGLAEWAQMARNRTK